MARRASVWDTAPLVVGHRGGRGVGWPPENTIAAFERAASEGARAVELDVHCLDGELVVIHDPPGVPRRELPADVPTLAEVLAWARDRGVAVNVELKHDLGGRAALARSAARVAGRSGAEVLFSSFDPALLALAAALAPGVERALLVHAAQGRAAGLVQRAARPPLVQAVHLERTQTYPSEVARHLARGLRVGVWTVNDPREARDLASLGVSTLITDAPGELLAALQPAR